MNLEELLKKDELSIDEINRLLSLINAERKDDDKRIELYNHALFKAKKFDIQFLHGIYKNIEGYDLPEEEKRLLQNTLTSYMSEKEDMSEFDVQQMLAFIVTERKDDDKRIELFNHALYEAKKFDIQFLHGIYKNIEGYDLPEEEKRLLQNTLTSYMSEKEDMSEFDVKQMLAFIVTERKDDTEKAKLYNRVLFEASKHGAEMLNKVKSTIISASLSGEEDAFVNGEQKNHTNYGSASKHI